MSTENNENYDCDAMFDSAFSVLIDVSLATLALTFGWKYLISSFGYNLVNSNLEKVKAAINVSISDLRSIASESVDNPLVFVRGFVKPLSPDSPSIVSQGSGREGVLLQTTQTSKLDFFSVISRTVRTVRTIPFVLVEEDTSDSVVVNTDGCENKLLSLTKVYNQVQPTVSKFLGMNFSYIMQVEEKMLPLGREINAIGNVSISKDGTVQISACKDLMYFLSNKRQYAIKIDLYDARNELEHSRKIHGCLFFGLSVYIIFIRFRPHWKACYRRFNLFLRHQRQVRQQSKDNANNEGSD